MEQNKFKHLYRSRSNRIIFGVCRGLGEYFGIDPIIFRLIFVALTFGGGAGILLYIIMALLVPNEPLGGESAKTDEGTSDFKNNVQGLISELKEEKSWKSRRTWLGIIIIIFGVFLLLNQLMPTHFFNWGFFWAAFIIALGILVLTGKKRINFKKDVSSEQESKQASADQDFQKETVREIHHHHHYRRGGGVWRLFFGLLLLVLGFAFLAQNIGWVSNINFGYLLKFWPVLIIFWGLSVLSRGTWVGALLSVIFALVIIGLIIFSFFWSSPTAEVKTYNFEIAKDVAASRAEVTIKSGAATVNIHGGATALASGSLESNITELLTNSKTESGVQQATIETKGNATRWTGSLKNNLQVNLSEDIPLSLIVSSGVSMLDFDFSSLQLESFNLKSGVSQVNLSFGNRATNLTADVDAGVSSISISLPKDSGAKIYAKTGLSSKNFTDFRQIDENNFESNNYASSASKININLEAGVSNISVTWR